MGKTAAILSFCVLLLLSGCGGEEEPAATLIEMQTDMGRVVLRLYDDTPVHKKNFIDLVNKGAYDDILFHRVVTNFIVQSGDPDTRSDSTRKVPEIDYTLKKEVTGSYVHTSGKLAAARQTDDKNPEQRSSGSQFYFVTGGAVSGAELDAREEALNNKIKARFYQEFQNFRQDPDNPLDFEMFLAYKKYKERTYYTSEMRAAYARLGGAPNLDFEYTIFGEVVTGMDVIKRIEQVPTEGERPLKAIRITKMKVMNQQDEA